MSNKLTFELVQPDEFHEYFYSIIGDDDFKYGEIRYYEEGWRLIFLLRIRFIDSDAFISISNKINELNQSTKADKLFGFL